MTIKSTPADAAERLGQMGLINPTDRPVPRRHRAASRLATLNGKRAGFLDNRKTNGDLLLRAISDLLAARFDLVSSLWQAKFIYSREAEPATLAALTEGSDFVITAIGD